VAFVNAILLVLVAAAGCADALTNTYHDRVARREIGRWILTTMGPGQAILGSDPRAWTLAYYAQGHYYGPAPEEIGQGPYASWIRDHQPGVVIVTAHKGKVEDVPWYRAFLRDEAFSSTFRPVPAESLPPVIHPMLVLARPDAWNRAVQRQPAATASRSLATAFPAVKQNGIIIHVQPNLAPPGVRAGDPTIASCGSGAQVGIRQPGHFQALARQLTS
jgi:hypothetical protein